MNNLGTEPGNKMDSALEKKYWKEDADRYTEK